MGRDRVRYSKLRIFGIAAGLAGVLLLAGCTKTAAGSSYGNGKETLITGYGTTVVIEGVGAAADGSNVIISSSGTYRLTGNITGGGVMVEAGKEDEVRLVLDGVSITSPDYSAICAGQSGLLTIVLEDGTENKVSDGNSYTYPQTGEDEPDAAIFSKDNMVFEGNGMLTVSGNYMNGIRGKDSLTINSGTYVIEAAEDGMKGKDAVEVNGGEITITSGSDGIQSNNDTEEDKGYVRITGGTIRINSEDDGINAAGKKDENPAADTLAFKNSFGNRRGQDGGSFGVTEGAYIRISGGDVKTNASGDGIDSNGDLYLEGGTVLVEGPAGGGDGALDYDGEGSISGGTILTVGSAGMFRTFSEESSQSMLVVYFDEIQAAGSTISVKDGQGNQLTETKVSKTFEALLFSSPELKTGEIYYIEAGDQDIQVAVNSILNQYGGPSGSGFGRMPGGGAGDFEKKPGVGNISGKASVVEIQETLLAETLPEGIHILGSRGNVE